MRKMATVSQMDANGLGPRKTFFIMVTLVGCIAILWPKVFYPMMFGGVQKQNLIKEHRGTVCCDVVVDRDAFMNASVTIGRETYRKRLNIFTGEMSLRQERPPHLRPESIHPAMRERGRAIPTTPTVPIVERGRAPSTPPRIVEGRPGPIPGMRPPMGAGSVHQAQQKGSNMGFIMPLYTVGIVAFFIYTVMRILFKKRVPNAPYGPARHDPKFRQEVFGNEPIGYRRPDDGTTKLGWKEHRTIVTAIQGLIDATDEQLKRRDMSTSLSKEPSEISSQNGNISNGHPKHFGTSDAKSFVVVKPLDAKEKSDELIKNQQHNEQIEEDRSAADSEKTVKVLGMELTVSCEGGQKWTGPPTPVYIPHPQHSDEVQPEPQSIFLEGSVPYESKILVADSEIRTETVVNEELNGTAEEPAVVLSSKMTLSLINLNTAVENEGEKTITDLADKKSLVDQDTEIMNG